MARLLSRIVVLCALGWLYVPSGSAHGLDAQSLDGLDPFIGDAELPSVPELPFQAESESMTVDRLADVLVALAFLASAFGLGLLLQRNGLPSLQPAVFAACALAGLTFTVVNTGFWQIDGVRADREGVTVSRHTSADPTVAWGDIVEIRLESGELFPLFMDDSQLGVSEPSGKEREKAGQIIQEVTRCAMRASK